MRHRISLFILLSAFWLINSSANNALLLSLGVASVLFVLLMVEKLKLLDKESLPLHIAARLLPFYLWLLKEIVIASCYVLKKIVFRRKPIEPVTITIETNFNEDLCKVIFANSITLVPGTLCLKLTKNSVTVHALSQRLAAQLQNNELALRVKRLEGKC
ncbi:Na+/H+ antiporter subunit E [Thalassotalea fusca]